METSKIPEFISETLGVRTASRDPTIFNEVSDSLKILNEQHRIIHTTIKDMVSEYHVYHLLSEKCEEIAIETPHTYFESLYKKLSLLDHAEFKD